MPLSFSKVGYYSHIFRLGDSIDWDKEINTADYLGTIKEDVTFGDFEI